MYFFNVVYSLSLSILTFIPVALCIKSSFLVIAEQYSIMWLEDIWLIHSPVEGHLGDLQFGAVVRRANMNIQVQVFAHILSFGWHG